MRRTIIDVREFSFRDQPEAPGGGSRDRFVKEGLGGPGRAVRAVGANLEAAASFLTGLRPCFSVDRFCTLRRASEHHGQVKIDRPKRGSAKRMPGKRPKPQTSALAGNKARTASSVSASATGLSRRQRSMRGKRTATPLRWRLLLATPSKPSSNTWVGFTLRTGPKVSTVVRRIIASISPISASDRPE